MTDQNPPKGPPSTTTSIWPAATVVLVAVGTLAIFFLINLGFDRGTTTTTTVAVVGGLPVDTSSTLLAGCVIDSIPPSDIASGLIVPIGTSAVGPINHHQSDSSGPDCSRTLVAAQPESKILGFYQPHLEGMAWKLFSSGVAVHGGNQDLFQKAGSDTFYWIEGITIVKSSANSTTWTLRLYQNNSIV